MSVKANIEPALNIAVRIIKRRLPFGLGSGFRSSNKRLHKFLPPDAENGTEEALVLYPLDGILPGKKDLVALARYACRSDLCRPRRQVRQIQGPLRTISGTALDPRISSFSAQIPWPSASDHDVHD